MRHEDDIDSVQGHACGKFRKVRVVAKLDAEPDAGRLEDPALPAGVKYVFFGRSDVQFSVNAERPFRVYDQMAREDSSIFTLFRQSRQDDHVMPLGHDAE